MIDNPVGDPSQYIAKINAESFDDIALELFRYQYAENNIYAAYVNALGIKSNDVRKLDDIPFLPISFFKNHVVVSGGHEPEKAAIIFESSGTTGSVNSRHFVFSSSLYDTSLHEGFRRFYGDPSRYAILALLPSYLERKNASLVYMARSLMAHSGHTANGFYLDEWQQLADKLTLLESQGQKTLLIGVTFALLDFAAAYPMQLSHTTVMETGGMKGRREEWTRAQVHSYLRQQWGLPHIHSEYGMTELLSQAYAKSNGLFHRAKTMKVLVRELNDPLQTTLQGSGCLNIVDLANVDSCAFIATEDLGNVYADGSFEVLGRMDHAALRGCSLMAV